VAISVADVPTGGAGNGAKAGRDPLNDFCRIWGHSAAVVDNKLFLDGGYLNWTPLSQNHMNSTSELFILLSFPPNLCFQIDICSMNP